MRDQIDQRPTVATGKLVIKFPGGRIFYIFFKTAKHSSDYDSVSSCMIQ